MSYLSEIKHVLEAIFRHHNGTDNASTLHGKGVKTDSMSYQCNLWLQKLSFGFLKRDQPTKINPQSPCLSFWHGKYFQQCKKALFYE